MSSELSEDSSSMGFLFLVMDGDEAGEEEGDESSESSEGMSPNLSPLGSSLINEATNG